jgi:hypothetical protein
VKRFKSGELITNANGTKIGLIVGISVKSYLVYDYKWHKTYVYSYSGLGKGVKHYESQKQTQ